MRSIEQIARFTIAVYDDYCARGLSPDTAREKAISEVFECTEGLMLIDTRDKKVPGSSL